MTHLTPEQRAEKGTLIREKCEKLRRKIAFQTKLLGRLEAIAQLLEFGLVQEDVKAFQIVQNKHVHASVHTRVFLQDGTERVLRDFDIRRTTH